MAHGHETTSTEQGTPAPALCLGGCGFYGSAATGNMCSKCYLRQLRTTPHHLASPVDTAVLFKDPARSAAAVAAPAAASEAPVAEAAPAKVAPPTRCMACKKKVGLLGFSCRCGGTFCSLHRYVDGHACNFDYKKVGREKIAEQNPLVVAPKITKI